MCIDIKAKLINVIIEPWISKLMKYALFNIIL